jgi:hypothetical protein
LANLSFSVLRLAVLTTNLPARRIYEAMGDGQHKGFPDAALLGGPLIGEHPAITRHDVFADLDRCPGHIEGRPEQVEDRLRVREPEESGFFGGRHASCDLLGKANRSVTHVGQAGVDATLRGGLLRVGCSSGVSEGGLEPPRLIRALGPQSSGDDPEGSPLSPTVPSELRVRA